MLRANLGYNKEREANILVFGLSHVNLKKLIDESLPIHVRSNTMALPSPGVEIVFMGMKNPEADITRVVKSMGVKNRDINVLCIDKKFYVVPFSRPNGQQLYMIGFDETSREALLAGNWLQFRVRELPVASQSAVPVEVLIFSGENETVMEEQLRGHNDISTSTSWA